MTLKLTAQKLVDQVRQRTSDEGGLIWTAQKILDAADFAFQSVSETVRLAGQDHELDYIDLPFTSFTRTDELWYDYEVPEYISSIRLIEGVGSGQAVPIDFWGGHLERRRGGRPFWVRSRLGRPGMIGIMGDVSGWSTARLWFIRRYPPLHYGTAAAGSTTSLTFAGTPTAGTVVLRDGLYTGLDVEMTNGANKDLIRRISSYTAGVATFSQALPAAITIASTYSLVLPLEPEHGDYFVEEVTRRLLLRLGNREHIAAQEPQYRDALQRFKESLGERDVGNPSKIWSHRR